MPFKYTGRRLDEETGLYYYRARYYSAEIGRFLQTDPIGYGDGLNWYAYVGNDPMNGTDSSGECPWCLVGAVGGAEYLRQKAAGEEVSLLKIAVSAGAGALTGGVGAISSTVASLAGRTALNTVVGAVASAGTEVGHNAIDGKETSASDVGKAALQGAAFGAGGSLAGDGAQALAKGASNAISSVTKGSTSVGARNLASGISKTTASAGGPGGSAPVSIGAVTGSTLSNATGNKDLVGAAFDAVTCKEASNGC